MYLSYMYLSHLVHFCLSYLNGKCEPDNLLFTWRLPWLSTNRTKILALLTAFVKNYVVQLQAGESEVAGWLSWSCATNAKLFLSFIGRVLCNGMATNDVENRARSGK